MSPLKVTPRSEKVKFNTQVLTDPRLSATVMWDVAEGELVTVVGFDSGFAMIDLGADVTGGIGYVQQDAVGDYSPPRGASADTSVVRQDPLAPGEISIAQVLRFCISAIAAAMFYYAGKEMRDIESISGDSIAEAFYQAVGLFSWAMGVLAIALGFTPSNRAPDRGD